MGAMQRTKGAAGVVDWRTGMSGRIISRVREREHKARRNRMIAEGLRESLETSRSALEKLRSFEFIELAPPPEPCAPWWRRFWGKA